jgi:competence protein ComEC
MSVAVLVGMASGRLVGGLPALALAVLVLLAVNPLWATNYGFVLSVLATAGLLTLTRPLSHFFERWLPAWLAVIIAVPLAASLMCQPVIILLSPNLPTYGLLANLLAVPAAGFATIMGLIVCVFSLLWMPLATLFAWIAWLPAEWIGRVAEGLSAAPFARIAWPPGWLGALLAVLCSCVFIVAVITHRKRVRVLSFAALALGLSGAGLFTIGSSIQRVVGVPPNWKIAACDVGQGDAFLLRAQDQDSKWHTALIDTGRSPELLRDCLVRVGVRHLDLLLLTHYDLDHVGGASTVFGIADAVIVGTPDNPADEKLKNDVCERAFTCDIGTQGMFGSLGDADWKILWPNGKTPGMQVGNPGSVTLLVQWPDLSALFTGDLGAAAQDAMLSENQDIPVVDVLKVAHHGSSDTSETLIQRIQPRTALISVGADNGYGHPTAKALAMLERSGAVVARTDRQGMLFICGRSESLTLSSDR